MTFIHVAIIKSGLGYPPFCSL